MALKEFTADVAVIEKLSTFPNAEDGLTAEELKRKFDEAPTAIKQFLNEEVVPAIRELQDGKADEGPASGIVLLDQVTGEAYTLYVVDGQLYIVAGGTAAEGTGSVLLEDHSGGDVYKIYVSDGALMMESEG